MKWWRNIIFLSTLKHKLIKFRHTCNKCKDRTFTKMLTIGYKENLSVVATNAVAFSKCNLKNSLPEKMWSLCTINRKSESSHISSNEADCLYVGRELAIQIMMKWAPLTDVLHEIRKLNQ